MTKRTAVLLHLTTLALTLTGIVYAYMHYMLKPVDPFSVVNHPLEPYMLQAHIVLAPVLVFLVGMILHSHILLKLEGGARFGRKSGLFLALLFGVMALSGYLLQIFTTTGHRFIFWLHLGSGSVWASGYIVHQVISRKVKRMMQEQRGKLAIGLALVLALIAAQLLAQDAEPFEREVMAMGTNLHITIYGNDQDAMLKQSELVLQTIEETEARISTWRPDSELSRFNRQPVGQPMTFSPSVCGLLQRVNKWSELTGHAFDPAMGALGEAWGIHNKFQIPSQAEIERALAATGMQHIRIDSAACTAVRDTEVLLDPGAFGKGEGLDRAAKDATLPMMMDFGGQILVTGAVPPGARMVTLSDPRDRTRPSAVQVMLPSGSLSTSGGSERDGFVNGRRISHILDPLTGQPVESFGSVTVWRENGFEADVLSTALYVMGPRKGLKWAEQNSVAACFLIVDKGNVSVLESTKFRGLIN